MIKYLMECLQFQISQTRTFLGIRKKNSQILHFISLSVNDNDSKKFLFVANSADITTHISRTHLYNAYILEN